MSLVRKPTRSFIEEWVGSDRRQQQQLSQKAGTQTRFMRFRDAAVHKDAALFDMDADQVDVETWSCRLVVACYGNGR